jgi:hypothetical protein
MNTVIQEKMMKKELASNGVRMRSQIKVGFDYCQKCRLGCSFLEGIKKEICYANCDNLYCKTGA